MLSRSATMSENRVKKRTKKRPVRSQTTISSADIHGKGMKDAAPRDKSTTGSSSKLDATTTSDILAPTGQKSDASAKEALSAASAETGKQKRKSGVNDDARSDTVEAEDRPSKKSKTTTAPVLDKPVVATKAKTIKSKKKDKKKTKSEPVLSSDIAVSSVINKAPTKALTVLVFGSGECGELGLGPKKKASLVPRVNPFLNPNDPEKFHVVQIACGGMHTVSLTTDNKIVSWGVNDNNALGRDAHWDGQMRDADASDSEDEEFLNPRESTPTAIPSASFPDGVKFVQVAAGDSCSFALTDTGDVCGWGTFLDSQGRARFRLDDKGELIEKQDKPILIQGLKKVTLLATGANHVLALDVNGTVWAWGSNEQNQLGRPFSGQHEDTLIPKQLDISRHKVKYIASGEYHAFAIDVKDQVWSWGLNSFGEAGDAETAGGNAAALPNPTQIRELSKKGITVIDGGAHHSAAVTADGQCLVWGRLDGGQLGIKFSAEQLKDETRIRYDEYGKPRICLRPTPVPDVGRVVHLACGTDHSIIINEKGHGYATGFGLSGQLGLGSEDDQEVMQRISGKKMDERELVWAGAGGQFSVVAASVKTE